MIPVKEIQACAIGSDRVMVDASPSLDSRLRSYGRRTRNCVFKSYNIIFAKYITPASGYDLLGRSVVPGEQTGIFFLKIKNTVKPIFIKTFNN